MNGTEKQVRWAEDIKATTLSELRKSAQDFLEMGRKRGRSEAEVAEVEAQMNEAIGAVEAIDDAVWFIDNRHLTPRMMMQKAVANA